MPEAAYPHWVPTKMEVEMKTLLLTAAAAALLASAGAASAKPVRHHHASAQCRHAGHTMHHGKGCHAHMTGGSSAANGMGIMQGMKGMDHSSHMGGDHMMGGGMAPPSPTPSPKP
jgi:hypothetical protein